MELRSGRNTYLFLLHVEVVDDDADEEVECEERAKHDEQHKVKIHELTLLTHWLLLHLVREKHTKQASDNAYKHLTVIYFCKRLLVTLVTIRRLNILLWTKICLLFSRFKMK